jgi:hypothetical protein
MMIIAYILFAAFTYLSWTVIHEVSHIAAASMVGKISEPKIIPYPHFTKRDGKKNFYFARATWRWEDGYPSDKKRAFVSLAPRIPNLLACILLIGDMVFLSSNLLLIFCIGGLVDLAIGSIGYREKSDLRRAATRLNVSPWIFRVVGWVIVLALGIPALIDLCSSGF